MGHGGLDSEPRRIGISRSRRNSPRVIFDEAEIEAEQAICIIFRLFFALALSCLLHRDL